MCANVFLHFDILQIDDGEIFATINLKDGMVSFHDNPEKYNSAAMLLELDKEVILLVEISTAKLNLLNDAELDMRRSCGSAVRRQLQKPMVRGLILALVTSFYPWKRCLTPISSVQSAVFKMGTQHMDS